MASIMIRDLAVADLPAVAQIHLVAFPNSALSQLGAEAVRRYYAWQLSGPHDVAARGAVLEHRLAGFCFGGVFRGALSGFLRNNRRFLVARVLSHPHLITNALFRERIAMGLRLLGRRKQAVTVPLDVRREDASNRSFGILALATDPLQQRMGVGRTLMADAAAIAQQRGFTRMHLTVHPDNLHAVRFYERLDWEREWEDGIWKGRMHREIQLAVHETGGLPHGDR